MNIALFSDSYLPTKSGVVTVVIQLRKALEQLGHHVVIVTVDTTDDVEDDPLVYRALSMPLGLGTDQYIGFPNILKVLNFLREHEIEIIHCHTEFHVAHVAKLSGKKLHIPVIATTHTMWEDFYTHYFPFAQYVVRPKAVRKVVRRLYKKFYALINVSAKAELYFKRQDMLPNTPSVIIPNAIDTSVFLPSKVDKDEISNLKQKLNIKDEDVVLLFVGRVAEEKRVFELLDICARVINERKNVKAVFVGDGPALDSMQRRSVHYKLGDRLVFTGFVEWRKLYRYYNVADIFVTASMSEMHSMTILEAMFNKLPVVVRDDLSYMDTVFENRNGLLAKTDNDFVQDIITLVDDEQKRIAFGKESMTIAHSFDIKKHVQKTVTFYEAVISSYSSGRPLNETQVRQKIATC